MTREEGLYLIRLRNLLIEGPRSIYPAGGDRHQWLESTVAAILRAYGRGYWQSWQIFCDANSDDEIGYLTPMVRFAEWRQAPDISLSEVSPFLWPDVRVTLAQLLPDDPALHTAVRELQMALVAAPFPVRNLPVRRDFGEGPDFGPVMEISVLSGFQVMERSIHVAEAPELVACTNGLEQTLHRLAIPVNRADWLERYDHGPAELRRDDLSWFWNGDPVS